MSENLKLESFSKTPPEQLIVDKYATSAKADEYAQMAWPHLSESHRSEPFYAFIGALVKKYINSFKNIKPTCLEVGFGSGRILYEMFISGNAGRILGIEYSSAMLEKSKEVLSQVMPATHLDNKQESQVINGIELKIGDIQSIPCPNESFNIVVSINILDRIADTKKSISEIVRALRPSGYLIVVTACDYENNTPPEQRLTPDEIEDSFIAYGCQLVEKHTTELLKDVAEVNKKFKEFVYVFNKELK